MGGGGRKEGGDRQREEIEREEHTDYIIDHALLCSGSTWPTPAVTTQAEDKKDKGKYCSEYRLKIKKRRRTKGGGGGGTQKT